MGDVFALAVVPILVQGMVMAVDEFHFHRKRGLGWWERWGHPIDTLSVLAPIILALLSPWSATTSGWFWLLSLLSCVIVTKDEWVHRGEACANEHWLHAVLFLLHPLVFIGSGLLWHDGRGGARAVLLAQAGGLAAFLSYQVLWWCVFGRGRWPR